MAERDLGELYGDMGARVNPDDFELEQTPAELQGLTPQTLFDMYDQATKWGNPYGETGRIIDVYNPQAGWGIHVSASPFTRMMSVIRIDGNGVAETTRGVFPLKPKIGVILWDRRLTVDEAVEALSAHDKMASEAGYVDAKSGHRKYKGFSSS